MSKKVKHDVLFAREVAEVVGRMVQLGEQYDGVCSGISDMQEGKFHLTAEALKELRAHLIAEYGDRFPLTFQYHSVFETDKSEKGFEVEVRVCIKYSNVTFYGLDKLSRYEDECAGQLDFQDCIAKAVEELKEREEDDD